MPKQKNDICIPEGSKPRQISVGPGFKAQYSKSYIPKGTYGYVDKTGPIIWLKDVFKKKERNNDGA